MKTTGRVILKRKLKGEGANPIDLGGHLLREKGEKKTICKKKISTSEEEEKCLVLAGYSFKRLDFGGTESKRVDP